MMALQASAHLHGWSAHCTSGRPALPQHAVAAQPAHRKVTASTFLGSRSASLQAAGHAAQVCGGRGRRLQCLAAAPLQALEQTYSKTSGKALSINLDPQNYGSFAEIGAGQEVARWFFR